MKECDVVPFILAYPVLKPSSRFLLLATILMRGGDILSDRGTLGGGQQVAGVNNTSCIHLDPKR